MSELREEQEMEAEALEAIFMESFKVVKDSQPFRWSVRLAPVDCGGDAVEDEKENHVVVNLLAEIPLDYPESSPPELDVEIVRGLAEEQRRQILDLAKEEAEANAGMAAIFTVCEAVREWLGENNIKGQDDGSMYAQMIWKQNEAEKAKVSASRRGWVGWGGVGGGTPISRSGPLVSTYRETNLSWPGLRHRPGAVKIPSRRSPAFGSGAPTRCPCPVPGPGAGV